MEPKESMFTRSVSPEKAPDKPTYVEIEFEQVQSQSSVDLVPPPVARHQHSWGTNTVVAETPTAVNPMLRFLSLS